MWEDQPFRPDLEVYPSERDPVPTGLLDARGRPILRRSPLRAPGFITFDKQGPEYFVGRHSDPG